MSLIVYQGLEEKIPLSSPVVTVGSFDGVHRAHQSMISLLCKRAQECAGEAVLITFEPHPRLILPSYLGQSFALLNQAEEKWDLLEKAGLKHVCVLPFTPEFSRMSASDFIKQILIDKIGMRKILIGYNHMFGKGREGNFDLMSEISMQNHIEVEYFSKLSLDDEHLSSSQVRRFLQNGDITSANKILGYEYFIYAKKQNQVLTWTNPYKLLPADGLYGAEISYADLRFSCVACVKKGKIQLKEPLLDVQGSICLSFLKKISI